MAELRKYGTASAYTPGAMPIRFSLRKAGTADFATDSDWTPAAGDVKVSKDNGTVANIATLPIYENGFWTISLSESETSCRQLMIRIVDQTSPKAIDDFDVEVQAYGNTDGAYPEQFADAWPSPPVTRQDLTFPTNFSSMAIDSEGGVILSPTGLAAIAAYFPANLSSLSIDGSGVVAANVSSWGGTAVALAGGYPAVVLGGDPSTVLRTQLYSSSAYKLNVNSAGAARADVVYWQGNAIAITYVDPGYPSVVVYNADDVAGAVRTELATELARIDAAVSTRATPADISSRIAAGITVTAISPVDVEGNTTIVQGDDYVDGSANPSLTYTVAGYTGPSVSGATVTWKAVHMSKYARTGTSTADVTVTANTTASLDGTTLTIKVPMPAATTALFAHTIPNDNDPNYKLTVTLNKSGKTLTEVIADLRVLKRIA